MCGIAGILRHTRSDEGPIPESWLSALAGPIAYRGPNGSGRCSWRAETCGGVIDGVFLHTRLSIIDHEGGAQPMVMPGGGVARPAGLVGGHELRRCARCQPVKLMFNGCVYGADRLRRELEQAGHDFTTDHSDTETLVHGWCEWGGGVFERAQSMHAAALWDEERGELVLSRDLFGEKPLYIADVGSRGVFAFAGSVGSLVNLLRVIAPERARVKPGLLLPWLKFGYDPILTPFDGVEQMPQDCHAVVSWDGGWRKEVVKRTPRSAEAVESAGGDDVARVTTVLDTAVRDRLEADVPIGCLLSGGVDSSVVAALARRHVAELTTICVRMPVSRYDESAYAGEVARSIGSRHQVVDVSPKPAEDLVRLISILGLPFGDSSLLPASWAFEAASRSLGVVLTGDGGDELFLGYDRYFAPGGAWIPGGVARLAARALPRQHQKSLYDKAARLLGAIGAGERRRYSELLAVYQDRDLARLSSPTIKNEHVIDGWTCEPSVMGARAFDLDRHLPGDMLRKVDTASMAHAVEARSPLLDSRVRAAALALGQERLAPGGRRKWLLKEVARKLLPGINFERPKMGFAVPIGEWFRDDTGGMRTLLHDNLQSHEPFGSDATGFNSVFSRKAIGVMLREHDDAGTGSLWPWKGRDHAQRLFVLLVCALWARGLVDPG